MKNKNWKKAIGMGAILVAGCGAAAFADDLSTKVLSDLHRSNQMEIHMGQMAKEKAVSADVKAYGEQLAKDHQDSDDQVLSLAKKDGITLQTADQEGMMAKHEASEAKECMTKLSAKSGADFDKEFAKAMVKDHKKDISKLEKADKSLTQADVKELVEKTLPTLRQHLATAQQLAGNS